MTRPHPSWFVVLLGACGPSPKGPPVAAPVTDTPITDSPAADSPAQAEPAEPGPLARRQQQAYDEDFEPSMMDEPTFWGWSADGEHFVLCHETPGQGCDACEFIARDDTRESVSTSVEPEPGDSTYADECSVAARDRIEARFVAERIGEHDSPSPLDGEVVLDMSDQTSAERGSWLRIHAQTRDGRARVVLAEIRCPEWCDLHVDVVASSPSGDRVAIVVHEFSGEFTDELRVTMLDVASVIERVGRGAD